MCYFMCDKGCTRAAALRPDRSLLHADSITSLFAGNQFQLRIPSCVKKALAEAFTAHFIATQSLMELLARRYNPPEIQIFFPNLLPLSLSVS